MKACLLSLFAITALGSIWAGAAPVESDLLKTLKPTVDEKKPWELTLAAGTMLNSGNSDTRMSTASALYEYKGKDSYDNLPAPGRKSNDVSILGALAIRL